MSGNNVDVDAVNERLNGLVALLKAVGVGDTNSSNKKQNSQFNDDQIQDIIHKLQLAQTEAPQIIAALEAHQKRSKQQQQRSQPPPSPQRQTKDSGYYEEDYGNEDNFDDEDDDDDANYPMVGHGHSDDISVVSDLTTPTVMPNQTVPEEEHYRDTLPPMIVGGNLAVIAPTKRKNLVNAAVSRNGHHPSNGNPNALYGGAAPSRRPGALAAPPQKVGGAAANRRKHYNATMEKLAHEGSKSKTALPSSVVDKNSAVVKKKSKPVARRSSLDNSGWASGGGHLQQEEEKDWNMFESRPGSTKKMTTMIDDDGFLTGDAAFDPFAKTTFKTSAFDNPEMPSSKPKRKLGTKSRSSRSNSPDIGGFGYESPKLKSSSSGSGSKPRRSRRASLAM
jgi:hypothetical protein